MAWIFNASVVGAFFQDEESLSAKVTKYEYAAIFKNVFYGPLQSIFFLKTWTTT